MIKNIIMNLSEDISSKWKITKYNEPINNYNIISVCFFIKYKNYKDKYINILIDIISNFKNIFINYRLRIYHDNTVINILNDIFNNIKNEDIINSIELYEYDIEIFRDEENNFYHKGTIGTLIRLLPLFDNEYHKVDKCFILDIDNKLDNKRIKIIEYLNNNDNIKMAYHSRLCYKLYKRLLCIDKNTLTPIMANFIYQSSINLPYNIFSLFLKRLYIKNNSKLMNLLNIKFELENIYEYGIDEIFLNKYYLKFFYVNKIEIFIILFRTNVLSGFNNILIQYQNNKYKYDKVYNFMFNFLKLIKLDTKDEIIDLNEINTINNEHFILNSFKNNYIKNQVIKMINNELNNNNLKKFKLLLNCILNIIKYMNPYYRINLLKINTNYNNKKYIIENIENIKIN